MGDKIRIVAINGTEIDPIEMDRDAVNCLRSLTVSEVEVLHNLRNSKGEQFQPVPVITNMVWVEI